MSTIYDSKDVILTVAGIPMAGFGENKITISRTEDASSVMTGADGETLFSKSNKRSGTISFDLLYGTDYDTYMDQVGSFQYLFPVTFSHTGLRGTKKNLVTWGMVQSQPDIALGSEAESRNWTLVVDSVDMSLGGVVSLFQPVKQVATSFFNV
jgi:hypothetical protein